MASSAISNPTPPTAIDPVIHITLPVSTKLTRENFLTWRSQIEPILDGFGLSKFLDSAVSPPEKNLLLNGVLSTNPLSSAWYQQDRFLLGWLCTTITEGILSQHVKCQTSRELWQALHQTFSAISTARIMELRRALQTSIRGNLKCGEYFEHMKRVADQLAAAGDPVPDSDLVRSILTGLGPEFNSFVVAITTRAVPVSLVDLHAFLLSHESLLTSQSTLSSTSADPAAFYAGRGRGRGRRGRGPNYSSHGPLLPTPGRGYSNLGPNRPTSGSTQSRNSANSFG